MTKPKALRNYFKKMYGVDLDAMSSVGVLKQFFKEKYDFDAEGSTVSEVLTSVLDSDIEPSGGGGSCDVVIVDSLPEVGEEGKTYLLKTHVMAQSYNNGETEGYQWARYEQGVAVADAVPQNFKKIGIEFCVNETIYYYNDVQDEVVVDNEFETDVVHVYSEYVDANDHPNEIGVFLNTLLDYDIVVFDGTNYVAPPYTYGDIPNA